GISSIATAHRWRRHGPSKWGIDILALLFIILGIILLFTPFISFSILMMLLGAFSLVFGIGMIVHSFRMRTG
ncbi:MAG: DUF308 domain-containing protein, partial [Deltaproteobacteria bacterium]